MNKAASNVHAQQRAQALDHAFQFNVAPDNVGLALEHLGYVKPRCKKCYGRGFMRFLTGDEYKRLPEAERRACDCVHRGYEHVRLSFARAAMALVPTYLAMEDAAEETMAEVEKLLEASKSRKPVKIKPLSEEARKLMETAMAAANADVLERFFFQYKGVAPADAA